MNAPFSWLWSHSFFRRRKVYEYVAVGVLTLALTVVLLVNVPWWLAMGWVVVGEASWVFQGTPRPGLLQHAAPFGVWLGWPPYYELRLWKFHGYLGWEPTARKGFLDLSVRLDWDHTQTK